MAMLPLLSLLHPPIVQPLRAGPLSRIVMGGGVPDVAFASAYQPREISALWVAVKKVYGSESRARRAVAQNNQVLAPVYASPELIIQSHKALVRLVGSSEALEIMDMNPAVLTLGSKGVSSCDPDEIRSAARTRQFLHRAVTPEGLSVAMVLAVLGVALKLAGSQ